MECDEHFDFVEKNKYLIKLIEEFQNEYSISSDNAKNFLLDHPDFVQMMLYHARILRIKNFLIDNPEEI